MSNGRTAPQAAWYTLESTEVLDRLESRSSGLTDHEAEDLRRRYGENTLVVTPPVPWWKILIRQVRSPIVALLAVAALGAWLVGDRLEAAAILAVLAVNTSLGFAMEFWARQQMDALRRLEVQRASVRRGGRVSQIDSRLLVPGDIVLVEAGEAVPADGRLMTATELRVVEAPLTGEALPVHKNADPLSKEASEIPLAERTSMVYKGTLVAAGSAEAVVVATGSATEIGQITELVLETEAMSSPLERRLDVLGRRLVWIALGISAVVAGLGLLRSEEWWLMVETGIALAIAAIPEGLPVVATIALAVGMRRMAQRKALIRRLSAVETLGSTTVVCADKTGTLTAGEMTAVALRLGGRSVDVSGTGYSPEGEFLIAGDPVDVQGDSSLQLALRIGALTNRAEIVDDDGIWQVVGDPTEAALLVMAQKAGLERGDLREVFPELEQIPFSSERMWMATLHETPDRTRTVYVKGAPDRLIARSTRVCLGDRTAPLDDARRRELQEANRELASQGLRVLALAAREVESSARLSESMVDDLLFVGLVGITDPPAPRVEETVRDLTGAGIRTVMITGDQALTALAVGRQLGLVSSSEEVAEGRFGRQEEEDPARLDDVGVFSRVSPADKLRIVEAFQQRGEIVSMLGDGVNDAPALKRADIGVAMGGRGTDVAKETAALVLLDDRFETLCMAVKEGRIIFDNIRKFVFYLFSCNLAEVLVLFIAGLFALPLPLLPLQILWLNLVTDVFPALALAVEPAEPGVMRRRPRDPQAAILSRRFLTLTGLYATLLTATTLGAFIWSLTVWQVESAHAVTLAFMTLALAQLLHVFNARSSKAVILSRRLFGNPWVWAAFGLTVGLQLLAVYEPHLVRVLHTVPLGARDWGLVLLASFLPLLVGQGWKILRRRG